MRYFVGIDVGGTFTDGVVINEEGHVAIFKTPTVPRRPAEGFLKCLELAAESLGLSLPEFLGRVDKMTYGTTIATNLLVEGKGAKTALLTTRGFKDTLPIARINREFLDYDLQYDTFPILLPRRMIREVSERVDSRGVALTPLDEAAVEQLVEELLAEGIEAMAVAFLWSFKNPEHEERVQQIIAQKQADLYISLSSRIAPLIGEYERTATVVMNARLGPPIQRHLADLSAQLEASGLKVPILIMQSTGGVVPAADASVKPVTMISSGPAGGVIAAKYLADQIGITNVICMDMGGTSLDASLITDGYYSASVISRAYNHSVYVPMIDVFSIGAGGGSLAWLDMGTRIKVGPQSAGADPGPACYDRGGQEPTVTDADVVLGYIAEDRFLGGKMTIKRALAEQAIERSIACPLGITVTEAAAGVRKIVDANMADAIRVVTIEKGYDPREYTMMAFGGAGPTHATSIARELGVKRVVVAPISTVQSAFGIVSSDIVHSFSRSDVTELTDFGRINALLAGLEQQGRELMTGEKIPQDQISVNRFADIRYKGQAHEVTIPLPTGQLDAKLIGVVAAAFEQKYEALYGKGSAYREVGMEIVTMRVNVVGATTKGEMRRYPVTGSDPSPALRGHRQVVLDGQPVEAAVYEGDKLLAGNRFSGPAIVEYPGTTVVMLAGQTAQVDSLLNLILEEDE